MIRENNTDVQDMLYKYFSENFVIPSADVFASDCCALISEAISDGVPCHEINYYFVEDSMNALSREMGFSRSFLDNKRKGLSYLEAVHSLNEQCLRAAFMVANKVADPDEDFAAMTKGEL